MGTCKSAFLIAAITSSLLFGCSSKIVGFSEKTPHLIGSFEPGSGGGFMHAKAGESGYLIYGPYWPLEDGKSRVVYTIMARGPEGADAGTIELSAFNTDNKAQTTMGSIEVFSDAQPRWKDYSIDTWSLNGDFVYEFRVLSTGVGDIYVKSIKLKKL